MSASHATLGRPSVGTSRTAGTRVDALGLAIRGMCDRSARSGRKVVIASTSERLAAYLERAKEYEEIIAAFEHTNTTLRATRDAAATDTVKEFCERQLVHNLRALAAMRRCLDAIHQEISYERGRPGNFPKA